MLNEKYEIKKTVRFSLKPESKNIHKPEKSQDISEDIDNFIKIYDKILLNFENIVFTRYDNNKLNWKLKIKFSWLKTYTKQEYYENNIEKYKKNINQVEIIKPELKYLLERFQNLLEINKDLLENIRVLSWRPEENKGRKSDLAYYFNQIKKRNNFEFIKELFNNNIQDTNWDDLINEIRDLTKKITSLLEWIEKTLLPGQSMWQVIEKASFNYYTVNKKPKNYEENITKLMHDFHKWLFEFKDFKTNWYKFNLNENWFNQLISNLDDELFLKRNYWNIEKIEKKYLSLKIENAYKLMKEYKSEQKSAFMEFLSKWFSFQDLKDNKEFDFEITKNETKEKSKKKVKIYLFDDITERKFNEIINLSNEIQKLSTEFNQTKIKDLKDNIIKLKKDRWEYFNERSNIFAFTKYWNFCWEYKKVAKEYWNIKALIKSLEKEKVDAEKTNSWALILEENNQKYLLTIPRETNEKLEWNETNLNKAKTYIDTLRNESSNIILYKFESLTLRALDKLCFWKENNSFRKTININIDKYPKFFNQKWRLKDKFEFKKNKDDKELDEKLLLDFYQTVLTLESTKKQIIIEHFKDFDKFINSSYENLDEFEKELKKTCYIKESKTISESTKNQLINEFNSKLYKITSYDLQKDDKEILNELKNKKTLDRKNPEKQTKLWLDFWEIENQNDKYPIRLNPEIKISFIEKEENFIKNHSELLFNRKFHDRYLLTTTITQNALNKEINLNYKDKDEIIKTYENYNNEFNKNLKQDWLKYFYWLDRWESELVSLWLFDLSKENPRDKWVWIDVWELKKDYFLNELENETKTQAYKNLSYFLENNEIFDKKIITSCFDLTTSKLVNWKIILNWDISTYLNLKLISAKRKIYELVSKWKNKSSKISTLDKNENILIIDWNTDKIDYLYIFDERYNNIHKKEFIEKTLKKYLDKVKIDLSDNDEVSIQKVNNLRDAICANMVWIMTFLQNKYSWMIFFEDLKIKSKNNLFDINNSTLWSRIEQKLLQKFVSLNQVPPTYKQAMSLQDEKNIKQLWIIWYIKTEWTSVNCPCCCWNLFWHWKWPELEKSMCHNEENKPWIMSNWNSCDYHMKNKNYWFDFIKSWDDLAAYNIAIRWKEFVNKL